MLKLFKQINCKYIEFNNFGLCTACNIASNLFIKADCLPEDTRLPSVSLKKYRRLAVYCFSSKHDINVNTYWFTLRPIGYIEREQFINWLIAYYEGNLFTKFMLNLQLPFRFLRKSANKIIKTI